MARWVAWGLGGLLALGSSLAFLPVVCAQELKFGVVAAARESEERAELEPLMTYLSAAIGRAVTLHVAADEAALRAQMEAGAVDIARLSPPGYADARRGGTVRLVAQSVLDGSTTQRALIVTRFDSGIGRLADLKGRRFAFVDSVSASGFVYPRAMLADKGIDPGRDFKETLFAGSHEKVIAAILLGPAQAGATSAAALGAATGIGLPTFDIVVLAVSDPIPHDAIAVRTALDESVVGRIRSALLDLDKSPAGRQMMGGSRSKLSGYGAADDSRYGAVRWTETNVGASEFLQGSTK